MNSIEATDSLTLSLLLLIAEYGSEGRVAVIPNFRDRLIGLPARSAIALMLAGDDLVISIEAIGDQKVTKEALEAAEVGVIQQEGSDEQVH